MDVWNQLAQVAPPDLREARLEIHHALQLVSIAVNRSLLKSRDDDSHTALSWLDIPAQWVGGTIPRTDLRAGLRPAELILTLGGNDDPAGHQLELVGRTREQALTWLRERLAEHKIDPEKVVLDFHYEMPPHAIENGARWSEKTADARLELASYFAAASGLLVEVTREVEAAPILTWPHHFDIATLLNQGTEDSGKTIGVGLSAGDGSYDEPYFYISPSPRPQVDDFPTLPAGHWHSEGFFSAVLTAGELVQADDPGERARQFVNAAIDAGRQLLG